MKLLMTCLLLVNAVWAQTLTMKFKGGAIRYDLKKGVYDVVANGKLVIGEAYAATPECKSTERSYLRYTAQKGKLVIHRANMQQVFYVDPAKPYFLAQVITGGASHRSSPVTGKLVAGYARGLVVPFDNDMWVRYEVKDQVNYTSSEVTTLLNEPTGMVIGSVQHKVWKSAITVSDSITAYGGFTDSTVTHDKMVHGRVGDSLCASPLIMVGFFDDWRQGMETYAAVNKQQEPPLIPAWKKATPMGWNSWGALQTKLNLQNARSVIDFFSDSCKSFRNEEGTLYIDLDSYWDNLNEEQLREFVTYCKSKNFRPGIYWAPFADWGKRDSSAWIKQNGQPVDLDGAYALDPTHPRTKSRIDKYTGRFKTLGFDMIKIDFLGHAALESDRFYNNNITTGMQAFATGMQYLDSVLDGKMLVYAAISPTMATGRYVHIRRIACDAFHAIDNTEYTLNSTGYGWWQSKLYQYIDADHIVFKNEPENAAMARLLSGIVTGTLITGDDYSAPGPWQATAKRLLQNKALLHIISDGKPFQPMHTIVGRQAPPLFIKGSLIAVFNYDAQAKKIDLPVAAKNFFTNEPVSQSITLPPASGLLLRVRK